ncbi:diguanylate cyclase domain-containing protein [Massilia sp. LXY-6]|uniref:diguanylate cyclase domain-containing protein n=1 Tax=Massilia sp. LXY-6 TaxID=3379823 RepID=UPI003EDE9B82
MRIPHPGLPFLVFRSILSSATSEPFSPALEAAYQADLAGEKIRMLHIACFLCVLLYMSSAFLDAGALPGHVAGAWIVRSTVVLATIIVAVAIRLRPEAFLRHYTTGICMNALIWTAGVEALMILSDPKDLAWSNYYAGLILVAMALYTWTYLRWQHAGLTGLVIIGVYVTVALFVQGMADGRHWPLLAQNCFFLVSANVLGMASMAIRERFSRQAFLLKNALARDLKLEEEAKRQSQYRSEHDALTGLPNRVLFLRRLDELLAARQGAATVAVLFLDLDGFKPVNDSHGHAAGDHVLAVIAERLRGTIRASDLAARLGGDEFVVAVPLADANGELVLRRLRAALRAAIAEPVEFKGHQLRVSASIGSALCPHDAGSAAQLVDLADQAMYESKRQRKRLVG